MVTHRFARAAESGDPTQIAALLAEHVTFHTPVLTQDLHGKDLTLRFLGEATRIIGNLTCRPKKACLSAPAVAAGRPAT
jgi:hypothetical protein